MADLLAAYPEIGVDLDDSTVATRQRVMVVDDEVDTVFLLKQILRIAGFNVLGASSGKEALAKLTTTKPDVVLLDIMMPDMDGWETFREIRQSTSVPVIFISALASKENIVNGLDFGADDYIAKPFHNPEVVSRVKAVLRRAHQPQEVSRFVFPKVGLCIDLLTQQTKYQNVVVPMSKKEFSVLSVLAKHAPAIVSYETISLSVWGEDSADVRKRTKYLIYLLRRKFHKINDKSNLILNIDRLGYKLQTEEE
ncbi:MAG: response regulator transcription factor [Anaerolineae bacterium]|nr:response regulator transcription factor [Anaerolineae bacterium]